MSLNSRTIKRIKSLGTEQSSDQGRFSPIKILDPGHKHFYRGRVCDYPLQNIHQQAICLVAIVEAVCTCPAECAVGAGSVAMNVQTKTICSSKSLSVQVQPVLLKHEHLYQEFTFFMTRYR